jgi:hypothetical protein
VIVEFLHRHETVLLGTEKGGDTECATTRGFCS